MIANDLERAIDWTKEESEKSMWLPKRCKIKFRCFRNIKAMRQGRKRRCNCQTRAPFRQNKRRLRQTPDSHRQAPRRIIDETQGTPCSYGRRSGQSPHQPENSCTAPEDRTAQSTCRACHKGKGRVLAQRRGTQANEKALRISIELSSEPSDRPDSTQQGGERRTGRQEEQVRGPLRFLWKKIP